MGDGSTRLGWPKASWVLAYFGVYFGYLWFVPESELAHWVTLVLLPWLLVWLLARRSEPGLRIREVGRRLGLARPRGNRGVAVAVALIALVQVVQLLNA